MRLLLGFGDDILLRGAGRHNVVALLCLHYFLPQIGLVVEDRLGGRARDRSYRLSGESCLDTLVTTEALGPCLLHDQHPQLLAVASGEGRPASVVGQTREVVVHIYHLPLAEQT